MNRLTRYCKTYVKTNKLYPMPQFKISPHELAEEEEKEQTDWGTVSSNFDSVEYKIEEDKKIFYPFYGWFHY